MAALEEVGAEPVALRHPEASPVSGLPGESRIVDLEDPASAVDALAGVEHVIHLAAKGGGIEFQRAAAAETFMGNRRVTDNVLAACRRHQVGRVFLASSLVVYRPARFPFDENHEVLGPADQPSPYAWSKITDEVVAGWEDAFEVVVGRFGSVYGPGASFERERATVIPALVARAVALDDGGALEVWGDGTAVRSFVFAEDAARAVVAVLASGTAGLPYNIDSGEPVTIAELVAAVIGTVNPTLEPAFDPSKPVGSSFRVPVIARLRALGYSPSVRLPAGLRKTVDWYRSHRQHV